MQNIIMHHGAWGHPDIRLYSSIGDNYDNQKFYMHATIDLYWMNYIINSGSYVNGITSLHINMTSVAVCILATPQVLPHKKW